ncbi:DUF4097 domain-containing protein [Streptomyces sp. NBC_01511]|uniref:DUF4097 family beta strand repeat-containing protein n=1 Tax=Streptomyces sp. NBC_01511 TaxID=2903889 RepID=UPI0038645E2F
MTMPSKKSMKKTKSLLLVAASVALAGTALTACDSEIKTEKSQYQVDEKVTSLRIKDYGGDIEVVTGGGSGISVTEEFEYTDGKPRADHSVKSGELFLNAPGCENDDASKCAVNYTVEVPAGTAVNLETGGGDITVRGLSGDTAAKTGGGNVRIKESAAKTVDASTGGDVDSSFTSAPDQVKAESGGGDVTVRLPEGTYSVDAETDGGNRDVGVTNTPSSAHKAKAHTGGGDVTVTTVG